MVVIQDLIWNKNSKYTFYEFVPVSELHEHNTYRYLSSLYTMAILLLSSVVNSLCSLNCSVSPSLLVPSSSKGWDSPTFPSFHIRHNSFPNPSVALPTSQLILQPFHCFTYITAHSSTLPLNYLHHSSFSNPSIASPMSQFILQPFHCFTYVTVHSPTLLLLLLRHKLFT